MRTRLNTRSMRFPFALVVMMMLNTMRQMKLALCLKIILSMEFTAV
jgi:hypothetical protein